MSVRELVRLSREFGADPEWVLAGGGNTSFKDEVTLYIKASGFALSTIEEDGFARMDRSRLRSIARASYPRDPVERERQAHRDLMAARVPGETKRPSVETVMHELLPQRFVIHTHPAVVNGLTCSTDGESAARQIFGDQILWISEIEPGYVLAAEIGVRSREYKAEHSAPPEIVLIQNHGLVVGANTSEEVIARHTMIRDTVRAAGAEAPDFTSVQPDNVLRETWQIAIGKALAVDPAAEFSICFDLNRTTSRFIADEASFAPLLGAFSPDHVVYAGPQPLYMSGTTGDLKGGVAAYKQRFGVVPRIVAVAGVGIFGCGETEKIARTALTLFLDSVKIAVFTRPFGGPRHMSRLLVEFIQGWEVEQYRSQVSVGSSPPEGSAREQ